MTTNEPQDQQLPEYSGNPFIASLPPILSMAEALKALNAPPAFHERERSFPDELRVHCIQRLNNYFLPLEQHLGLEMALSVLIRQGYVSRNPLDKTYFQRLQDGHDRIVHKDLLLGQQRSPSTASSMALVGCSGMGKSRTVERLLNLYPKIIYHEEPYSFYQIVWLKLDCPLQGSPKQLCISFFQAIDSLLGTNYIRDYAGPRRGLDEMIRNMFHVANLHAIGVLVIDEIQHLNQTRGVGPDVLLNFLVTLVNTIGIPVLTVGTHGAMSVLQGNFRQARRASGLGSPVWNNLKPDRTWDHFIDAMWRYQWTQEFTPLTDDLRQVLYEESQGIIDVVVKLFMLAQLRAIRLRAVRRRPERLDRELLLQVVAQDFKLIAPMLNALKRGDERALAKYDDLRSLQKHVQQVFADYAPPISAHIEFRGVKLGKQYLVLEIEKLFGRSLPCDRLTYSHPADRHIVHDGTADDTGRTHKRTTKANGSAVGEGTPEIDPRHGSRRNQHQKALPLVERFSTFDRDIPVDRVKVAKVVAARDTPAHGAQGSAAKRRTASTSPGRVPVSLNPEASQEGLPPIDFKHLERAEDYVGETAWLAAVVRRIAVLRPHIEISMSHFFLKAGREFTKTSRGRRACLVALFRFPDRPPAVLLDVDHTGLRGLAAMMLRYTAECPFAEMEGHIKALLDALVDNNGKWDRKAEADLPSFVTCRRQKKVLRRQGDRTPEEMLNVWTERLLSRLVAA